MSLYIIFNERCVQKKKDLEKGRTYHNVTVVVLARPNETARRLDGLSDHVVDETVLIVETELLKLGLVCRFIDLLENVLESAVVLLQDSAATTLCLVKRS